MAIFICSSIDQISSHHRLKPHGDKQKWDQGEPVALSDQVLSLHAWMGLLHPVLMILFVYPVVGATIRLGILAREKRLNINPIADTVPVEHAQHGAWVTGGVLVAVLIGLGHSLWSSHHLGLMLTGSAVHVQLRTPAGDPDGLAALSLG